MKNYSFKFQVRDWKALVQQVGGLGGLQWCCNASTGVLWLPGYIIPVIAVVDTPLFGLFSDIRSRFSLINLGSGLKLET
jgi:hypothetical protein